MKGKGGKIVFKRLLSVILLSLAIEGSGVCKEPLLLPKAREWCDETALSPVEGIWEYPDDGVVVLIKRADCDAYRYYITVLESDDSRLLPGMSLGTLTVTPDRKKFRLSQYSHFKGGVLTDLYDCMAELTDDGFAMKVVAPGLKFRYRPTNLLPGFLRSLRIQIDNPADRLSKGMLKIYPTFDGNGTRRFIPRAL